MRRAIACGATLAFLAAVLSGCGGPKEAARVNKDQITVDEFNLRTQGVTANELYSSAMQGGASRAGEFALRQLIQEKVILQLAQEKKVAPTDAQVSMFLAFAKRYPALAGGILADPGLTDGDKRRIARLAMAYRNLAAAPLKITDADLQRLYDDPRVKQQLAVPDQYHLRAIATSSKDKIQEALKALQSNVGFESVALRYNDDPQAKSRQGDVGVKAANTLSPAIVKAIENLKPNEYTPQPVPLGPPNGPPTQYALIQVVEKTPGHMPPLADVRPFLETVAISQKDPLVSQRLDQSVKDAVAKADIKVDLKQYNGVPTKMKEEAAKPTPPPQGMPMPAPAPSSGPSTPAPRGR